MDWLIYWTLIAQLSIFLVLGIVFSFFIRIWLLWWNLPTKHEDLDIFNGRNHDDSQ